MELVLVLMLAACAFCVVQVIRLRNKLNDVSRKERMISDFIRTLSHDIRTPLHSVSGLAEIISRDSLYLSKSEKKHISEQIVFNANLISTLLDEMMVFSHGGEGHDLEDETFSPNFICRRCVDSNTSNPLLADGVKIVFRREIGDEFFIKSDRHIVELVLNKLLTNACKFTKQGEIAIGCSVAEGSDTVVLFVEDTGNGIPKDRRGSIFGWFDKPEEAEDQAELDLSIAQRLAMKVGGLLRLDEEYNKGTRIEFLLPR